MLFISIYSRYTPKLYLTLQLSVQWLILVMLHATDVSDKNVSKVLGVVDKVSIMGRWRYNFMPLKMLLYPRQLWCQKFKLIGHYIGQVMTLRANCHSQGLT